MKDQRNLIVEEGDDVVVSVNSGMLEGKLIQLPSGLTLAGNPRGQQIALVQVTLLVPVTPDGVLPGVLKLASPPSKDVVN